MPDVRISASPVPSPRPQAKAAAKSPADTAAKPVLGGDRLTTQGAAPGTDGVRIIQEALRFPPKPKKGTDMTPWLMDAYSRLLKAESTMRVLQKSRGEDRVDAETYGDLRHQLWDAQGRIAKLDKDGAVKTEFFQAILPPARQLIDDLAAYPAPPADKAGKAEWLVGAKQELARAKAADELMNAAWFDFQALDFGNRTDSSSKLFDFESRVRQVEYALNPPAPRPQGSPASGSPGSGSPGSGSKAAGTSGPLFGNTQGAANLANGKNPVGQVAGAVALPFAVTLDVIDLITRPLRWLEGAGEKP